MEELERPALIGDIMRHLANQPEHDGMSGEANIMAVYKNHFGYEEIGT